MVELPTVEPSEKGHHGTSEHSEQKSNGWKNSRDVWCSSKNGMYTYWSYCIWQVSYCFLDKFHHCQLINVQQLGNPEIREIASIKWQFRVKYHYWSIWSNTIGDSKLSMGKCHRRRSCWRSFPQFPNKEAPLFGASNVRWSWGILEALLLRGTSWNLGWFHVLEPFSVIIRSKHQLWL